jgi:precorrin-6B methylase 2
MSGPFSEIVLGEGSTEGCFIPKILGTYEQPLHATLLEFSKSTYNKIINIGCAEGYYAIGLCKIFPNCEVHAFDIDEKAVEECSRLALLNNVQHRVELKNEFTPDTFKKFSAGRTFYFIDIEGAESNLINSEVLPFLKNADLIIECHSEASFGTSTKLSGILGVTHHVKVIKDNGSRRLENLPSWFYSLAHLDQLLCAWEWRSEPTPWVVAIANR